MNIACEEILPWHYCGFLIMKIYKELREKGPMADPVVKEWDKDNCNDTVYIIELIK